MVRSRLHGPDLIVQGSVELQPLLPDDPLGRYVLSERRARRALKSGIIAHDIFLERVDRESLSLDRLGFAPDLELAGVADRNAATRGKSFFGWAVVSVQRASEMARRVGPMPLLDNRFHAEIVLNLPTGAERRDVAKQHALNLAMHSVYRPRP